MQLPCGLGVSFLRPFSDSASAICIVLLTATRAAEAPTVVNSQKTEQMRNRAGQMFKDFPSFTRFVDRFWRCGIFFANLNFLTCCVGPKEKL